MNPETKDYNQEVDADLLKLFPDVLLQNLSSDEEADSQRSEVDDPRRDLHHHDAHTLEKLQQRLAILSGDGDSDPGDDGEDHQTELVKC